MANSILEQLKANGISVGQLAKELNITRRAIYQAINGEGSRSIRVEIACAIGKKPSDLWTENEKQSLRTDDALWLLNTIEGLLA